MVGDDDGPGVGDLLLGVGHQHAARARLHVGLGVAVALAQAPAQHSQWSVVTVRRTGGDPPLYRILHRQRPQFTVIYQLLWHLISYKISENVRVLKILCPREKNHEQLTIIKIQNFGSYIHNVHICLYYIIILHNKC